MRKLLGLLLFTAAAWCVYWFTAATYVGRGAEDWRQARLAEGWTARWSGPQTAGFPAQFSTVLRDIRLAAPGGAYAWTAPSVQIEVPSYKPTAANAIWPGTQALVLGGAEIGVKARRLETGVALSPRPSLPLEAITLVADDLGLSGPGWRATLAEGSVTTRQTPGQPLAHDLSLRLEGLALPEDVIRLIDPTGAQPGAISRVDAKLTAAFDRPLDRSALENTPPMVTMLEISDFAAQWGDIGLKARGMASIDAGGIPDGRFDLRVENWRAVFAIAKAQGLVAEGFEETALRALEGLAGLTGDPADIDAPLSFQNGFMSLGPVPLGPAPRLLPAYRQ
ncbi:MAG: DUF2125 domain-containing protein [Rhodobacteraceae bacterium]|nr:DUF2125 domain-containing protein [Paracoccaceae bacterium]